MCTITMPKNDAPSPAPAVQLGFSLSLHRDDGGGDDASPSSDHSGGGGRRSDELCHRSPRGPTVVAEPPRRPTLIDMVCSVHVLLLKRVHLQQARARLSSAFAFVVRILFVVPPRSYRNGKETRSSGWLTKVRNSIDRVPPGHDAIVTATRDVQRIVQCSTIYIISLHDTFAAPSPDEQTRPRIVDVELQPLVRVAVPRVRSQPAHRSTVPAGESPHVPRQTGARPPRRAEQHVGIARRGRGPHQLGDAPPGTRLKPVYPGG